MSQYRSAQNVKDESGRQYHLKVAPKEVAPYILLCGDPSRAEKTAKFFDKILYENRYREYISITGTYKDLLLTVVSTGIGCDNTEIAMVELSQCVENPSFLRIGTCGALRADINLGDIVISQAAVRLENTSSWFAPIEYPAVANFQIVNIALETSKKSALPHHVGITATCSGFYGAQERVSGSYAPWEVGRIDKLSKIGVLNLEMEASTLFVMSSIRSFRAGAICVVYANRVKDMFIEPNKMIEAETNLIKLGLDIMYNLAKSDKISS